MIQVDPRTQSSIWGVIVVIVGAGWVSWAGVKSSSPSCWFSRSYPLVGLLPS